MTMVKKVVFLERSDADRMTLLHNQLKVSESELLRRAWQHYAGEGLFPLIKSKPFRDFSCARCKGRKTCPCRR